MNYWLAEEMTRLTHSERRHKFNVHHSQDDFSVRGANWIFAPRVALKLSDWLIIAGESLRRRYDKTTPASSWVNNRKFAR